MTGIVLAGSSLAAVRTAQALRRKGFDGPIRMVGEEQDLPYDKPPLSKAALKAPTDEVSPLLTAEQAEELGIDLVLGTAITGLKADEQRLVLGDGSELGYDTLVLATGARARPGPWTVESGIHTLRTADDGRALRQALAAGGPVVVIGAGFIGGEVAASCRSLGLEVTIVDVDASPLTRVIGAEVSGRLRRLHEGNGVQLRLGVGVRSITGQAGDLRVELADGETLPCATIVVGIGAVPNTEWLEGSGLDLSDGVVCDGFGRTGLPEVYALGDVAAWHHPDLGQPHRIEHWTNVIEQAPVLASVITGQVPEKQVRPTHFVWSDQYDWSLHFVGRPAPDAEIHTVEPADAADDGERTFATVYADGDDLLGGVIANWPRASLTVRKAMNKREPASEVLTKLRDLAPPPAR